MEDVPMIGRQQTTQPEPRLGAWRFILVFGVVSLLMDFVYEGARSITGPLLASLGASGLVVGLVTGAGEAAALGLRLVSGPLADRSRRFWSWTIAGYTITAISVPLLGLAGGLAVASALVIAERVGKAVRSPAKDTLVSHATTVTGRGKGFAAHEAMDQIGALAGPLTVAGILAATGDDYGPALGVLVLPGAAALVLLFWLRSRVPDPVLYEIGDPGPGSLTPKRPESGSGAHLSRAFWTYALFAATTMTGFATFGVISFHFVRDGLMSPAVVPVVYAAAMAADAVAALAAGWLYDRTGPRSLVVLPLLAATAPLLAFTSTPSLAVAGALVWGAAIGIQESTLRATVADIVPIERRATGYGVFAGVLGAAALIGGTLNGALYDLSIPLLIVVIIATQALALLILAASQLSRRPRERAAHDADIQ